jgi:hypothetical protein
MYGLQHSLRLLNDRSANLSECCPPALLVIHKGIHMTDKNASPVIHAGDATGAPHRMRHPTALPQLLAPSMCFARSRKAWTPN